jgi:uncharacterized membrane protein
MQILVALAVGLLAAQLSLDGPPAGDQLSGQGWLWARIPLGLIGLFIVPGYTLGLLLFPRFSDLDNFERAGVAVGLSLAQYPLLALGLDRSPWGLAPTAIIVSVTLLSCVWGATAAVRLMFVAPSDLLTATWQSPWSLTDLSWLARVTALATVGVLVAVGWSIWVVVSQPTVPPLTEFFALGTDGLAQNYPSTAAPNQPINVTLGVHNLEGQAVQYGVTARLSAVDLASTPPFRVEAGETRTTTLTFALPNYGFGQHVDVLLFRSDMTEPYRRLEFVVDVPQVGVPTPVRISSTPVPTVARADATAAVPVVPTPGPVQQNQP